MFSLIQKIFIFNSIGRETLVKPPFKIWNRKCLKLGAKTFIAENSFFAITDNASGSNDLPIVEIGDNVCIGSNFIVVCIQSIKIEDNVLIADRVFIGDHIHGYSDVTMPIISQPLEPRGKVLIKEGAFIGVNSVVMPGVTIGKNAVIGASSVVLKDVPDYCVATGNPAKIIKKYDFKAKKWVRYD